MALNITVFDQLRGVTQAPVLNADLQGRLVDMGSASTAIAGPCVVRLLPDEDCRIAVRKTSGYQAPAATAMKLSAGAADYFELAAGSWYLSAAAA
jgi:hypothetical protein